MSPVYFYCTEKHTGEKPVHTIVHTLIHSLCIELCVAHQSWLHHIKGTASLRYYNCTACCQVPRKLPHVIHQVPRTLGGT